jgi:hypothetical protein
VEKHLIPDDLFVSRGKEIEAILQKAVYQALMIHKRAGNAIAVARDGKVVWIRAEEIPIAEEHMDRARDRIEP